MKLTKIIMIHFQQQSNFSLQPARIKYNICYLSHFYARNRDRRPYFQSADIFEGTIERCPGHIYVGCNVGNWKIIAIEVVANVFHGAVADVIVAVALWFAVGIEKDTLRNWGGDPGCKLRSIWVATFEDVDATLNQVENLLFWVKWLIIFCPWSAGNLLFTITQ